MTTDPAKHDLVEALRVAADALKPIANMVFNDNGDLTISPETPDYDQIVAAWRAEGRARRLLAASASEIPNTRAALASEAASQVPADGRTYQVRSGSLWRDVTASEYGEAGNLSTQRRIVTVAAPDQEGPADGK